MKKAITALENYKIINEIKKEKGIKIICKNLQYREAILEFLEINKNIDLIFLSEKIPGQISVEKLIKRIKQKNNNINIIFFLEKENIKKEEELKKLGIKNIYKKEKINSNNSNDKIKNAKIITVEGKIKSGKTTLTNLILKYLIENNKKILLINLNKKTEKNYFKILNFKKINNNNEKNFLINLKENVIKVRKNFIYLNNFYKMVESNTKEKLEIFFEKYTNLYDYILVDIGNTCRDSIKEIFIEKSFKNLFVIDQNFLGKKEIEELRQKNRNGLHIINNEYHLGGISNIIIKEILGKEILCNKILFNKNFKKMNYRYSNFEIDKKTKKELDKIFEIKNKKKKLLVK